MRAARQRSVVAGALALLALAPLGCRPKELVAERGGNVALVMPLGRSRSAAGDSLDGFIEQVTPDRWRARISWDPDPRTGPPSDEEALEEAGLAGGAIVRGARPLRDLTAPHGLAAQGDRAAQQESTRADDDAQQTWAVDGHPAALVRGPSGEALVWRCEKSGRIFRLLREGRIEDTLPLAQQVASVRCHDARTKPSNAQVPGVNLVALGDGWSLGKRTPASAVYLRQDALEVIFAGRKAEPSDDLVVAAHLAPAWIEAAGLREPHVETGERANGPQGHPAIALRGEATLDGRPVRWSLLEWRCLQHARTYTALVVSEAPPERANSPAPSAAAPDAGSPAPAAAPRSWTGYDAALLAIRCHG